jgi:hypothetical protein
MTATWGCVRCLNPRWTSDRNRVRQTVCTSARVQRVAPAPGTSHRDYIRDERNASTIDVNRRPAIPISARDDPGVPFVAFPYARLSETIR